MPESTDGPRRMTITMPQDLAAAVDADRFYSETIPQAAVRLVEEALRFKAEAHRQDVARLRLVVDQQARRIIELEQLGLTGNAMADRLREHESFFEILEEFARQARMKRESWVHKQNLRVRLKKAPEQQAKMDFSASENSDPGSLEPGSEGDQEEA